MAFFSILFPTPEDEALASSHPWLTFRSVEKKADQYTTYGNKIVLASQNSKADEPVRPGLYLDLNLDQILDDVLCHDADEELRSLFCQLCPNVSAVLYRQKVMRDLCETEAGDAFRMFLQSMSQAGRLFQYGRQAHSLQQRDKYTVDGAALYCSAVRRLLDQTAGIHIQSEGLQGFLKALHVYVCETGFLHLEEQTGKAKHNLEGISYSLRVESGGLWVEFGTAAGDICKAMHHDFDIEARWGIAQEAAMLKILPFRQVELSPLEVLIIKALAEKHPEAFQAVHEAAMQAMALPEPFLVRFLKELRFYLLYLDFMGKVKRQEHAFSYPQISTDGKVCLEGAFDLALAIGPDDVVENDFTLATDEKGTVITGANQGGKTTFARSIGQIAVLTALGLPVPCKRAVLPLYKSVFSQFTQAEDAAVDHGKLKEELLRLKPILKGAGSGSLVILNELFSSATQQDALDLAEKTLSLLVGTGAHVVCVTHIHGLHHPNTVSMVAQVQSASGQRLYKILRAEADGQAYAQEIAQKYHLGHEEIKERIVHGV